MIAATQLLNVGRGYRDRCDLSADQAETLTSNKNVGSRPALDLIFFIWANDDPKVSNVTSNRLPEGDPLRARLRLDREPRRQGRDPGAGRHPVDVPRLAAAERTGQDRRRQGQGRAQGVGCRRPEGDDDLPERPDHQRRPLQLDGAEGPVEPEGRRVQHRDLGLADLELADDYRSGSPFGLSLWGPDYPDPADYSSSPRVSSWASALWPKGADAAIRSSQRKRR